MKAVEKLEADLRAFALKYPETHEDFPWGERAIKVRGKVFLFMRAADDEVSISVKLPHSRDMATTSRGPSRRTTAWASTAGSRRTCGRRRSRRWS